MIVPIVLSNNNTNFTARLSGETKSNMTKILSPMIDSFMPIKEIAKQTPYTADQINRWSYRLFGMSVAKLYKARMNEQLKDEFIKHRQNRTTVRDMVKMYGHNEKWIRQRYVEMGADSMSEVKRKLMKENLPRMVEEGYTIEMMKRELKISAPSIYAVFKEMFDCTICQYKRAKNIHSKKK